MNEPRPDPGGLRAAELFAEAQATIARGNDRLFAWLLLLQWVAAIVAALIIPPKGWPGAGESIHTLIELAVLLGGLIVAPPIALSLTRPGTRASRHAIAAAQMSIGALLVHLCGGRIETHFHVFGSLALLGFYRDWRVLATASAIAAVDHLLLGQYGPRLATAHRWHWAELAAWVGLFDVFLVRSCLLANQEMREVARRRAELETAREQVEQKLHEQSVALNIATLIETIGLCETVEEAAAVALEVVRASFGWNYAVYRTVNPGDGTLRFAIGSGQDHAELDRAMAQVRLRPGEGLGGVAWQSRDVVIVPELKRQADGLPEMATRGDGAWSGAAFPILIGDQVVATMEFLAPAPFDSSREERKVLRDIARVASQAIERIKNVERERAAAVESAAFRDVLDAVGKAQSVTEAASLGLDAVRTAYKLRYGIYWTLDPSGGTFRFVVGSGSVGGDFRRASIASRPREGEGLVGRAWRSCDVIIEPDLASLADFDRSGPASKLRIRSGACLPLILGGEVIGALEFFSDEPLTTSAERIEAIRNLGRLISWSIERLQSAEYQRKLAEELFTKVGLVLDFVSAAATGDLTQDVPIEGDDAIGRIGEGLNKFLRDLRPSIEAIARNAQTLGAASEGLSTVSQRIERQRRADLGAGQSCLDGRRAG